MKHRMPTVKTGLDILVAEEFERLKNGRVGLLGHAASVNHRLQHLLDLCIEHNIKITRLFGPEHGFLGDAQYMESVRTTTDQHSHLPVISLYGADNNSLLPRPEDLLDIDILVCDLQDVGSRYYTFAYTLAFAMRACAATGTKCIVLDRPNPIGATQVEGNVVKAAFKSFVGEYPICNRHGLTIGELASLFKKLDQNACSLDVIWMENYRRHMLFNETGLPWILPSPNMPTIDTALVYPGACLFEGTNLSEGRGTTKPFELVGAPYIKDPYRFTKLVESQGTLGAAFRPCWFRPLADKHAGQLCGGLQIHVTNSEKLMPLRTGLAILWAARQFDGFKWRHEPYEFVSDRLAIDLLFGDDKPREMLEKGANVADLISIFESDRQAFLPLRSSVMHTGYEIAE